ncbi:Uncharacterised protein [Mycobacterium xenopi]|uniref:Uncharacterized protein n=1 Tax=Mycobacterium xenopi TaxID=1789 RepID=A0AAD1GZ00_MYCXE|nr:hypothetical protein MYXE_10890 [Mycobacterium xenopi]SPX78808.1 Uncharacterised protein [Mycobacterium xenopi]
MGRRVWVVPRRSGGGRRLRSPTCNRSAVATTDASTVLNGRFRYRATSSAMRSQSTTATGSTLNAPAANRHVLELYASGHSADVFRHFANVPWRIGTYRPTGRLAQWFLRRCSRRSWGSAGPVGIPGLGSSTGASVPGSLRRGAARRARREGRTRRGCSNKCHGHNGSRRRSTQFPSHQPTHRSLPAGHTDLTSRTDVCQRIAHASTHDRLPCGRKWT